MQFKKLRLHGFKSFVDPTELAIEQGVTGVVGPNGCGKSNLLEALRWVMGETSAKSMRGNDMDDVIFAGTDRRPARPFAEVMLTIDNSDFLAPAQFNQDATLEISRKITRDMGSTYRVNGKEVRAKDLQILFADAATGSHSPALVRQGQINQLIHAKPKQRRAILEDAAGIGGLYTRRHEAELRLRAAAQNLERLEDVLKSTETQINSLRRQAKQAEKYRILSSEIRKNESLLLATLYERLLTEKHHIESQLVQLNTALVTAEGQLAVLNRQELEATEKLAPFKEEAAIAGAVLKRAEIESATIVNQLNDTQQRIHRLGRTQENILEEKNREQELIQDATSMTARLGLEWQEIARQEDDSPAEMLSLQQRLDAGNKELTEGENRLEQLRTEISELQSRNKSLSENAAQAQNRRIRLEQDYVAVTTQYEQARTHLEQNFATEMLEQQAQQLKEKIRQAQIGQQEALDKLQKFKQSEKELREASLQITGKNNQISSELRGLVSLSQRTPKGTAKNLEQIHITIGYEKALGVVFGDELSYDDNTKSPRYWRLLPHFHEAIAFPEGVVPLTDHLTRSPDFLKRALACVGVCEELVAEQLQASLRAGMCLVSKTGKLWRADGFVIADGAQTQTALVLETKNRMAVLEQELVQGQAIEKEVVAKQQEIKQNITVLTGQEQQFGQNIKQMERSVQDIERKIFEVSQQKKTAEYKVQNIAEKTTLIERELQEATQHLQKAQEDLSKISGTDHLKVETETLKQQVTEKRMNLADARALLETHRRHGKERENRLRNLQKEKTEWEQRQKKSLERTLDCDKKLTSIAKELADLKGLPEKLLQKSQESGEKLTLAQARFKESETKLEDLMGNLSVLQKDLRLAEQNASSIREKKGRFDVQHETILLREQELLQKIAEKIESTPEDLRHELEQIPDEHTPEPSVLENLLRDLNRQRDGLGPVNLVAQTELEEIELQSGTLMKEKEDLLQAIKKLSSAIADINKDGRMRMLKAFDIVNNHFKKLFQHLFSGGTADLQLIESDDPLEAGLEIQACPPGKKTHSLTLLSGGEQALTCMALIFAVFLTNPSPICVLDEVDAPLDDANVERYCNLIMEMTKLTDTRFLVITHHALTMARTDRLFGVTMGERGVSQLVSVDLRAAEELLNA